MKHYVVRYARKKIAISVYAVCNDSPDKVWFWAGLKETT